MKSLGAWILAHRKMSFWTACGLLVTGLAVFVVLDYLDYELPFDALFSPTCLIIAALCVWPWIGRARASRSPIFVYIFAALFVLTLGLTTYLLFNVDEALGPRSRLWDFVWIRNSLLAFSAIIGVWIFYRSRVVNTNGRDI
jgi:FtsH-binding integral membrane protein